MEDTRDTGKHQLHILKDGRKTPRVTRLWEVKVSRSTRFVWKAWGCDTALKDWISPRDHWYTFMCHKQLIWSVVDKGVPWYILAKWLPMEDGVVPTSTAAIDCLLGEKLGPFSNTGPRQHLRLYTLVWVCIIYGCIYTYIHIYLHIYTYI